MKGFKLIVAATVGVLFSGALLAQNDRAANLQQLLRQVEQGKAAESQEAREREQRFQRDRAQQQNLLAQAQAEKAAEEQRSERLETEFEENELRVAELQDQLNKRLGSLKELFGVLQQVAGDTRANFENSVVSAQYPARDVFLNELAAKMGTASELATIPEMEKLWFEIQREMTESGQVDRFTAPVIDTDGQREERDITRVGAFNLVSDDGYLNYVPETTNIVELPRQPQDRFVSSASDMAGAAGGVVDFGVDPTRGQLLNTLIDRPTLRERIDQGGIVGYIIIAVGILGILIALERLITLGIVGSKVNAQLKSSSVNTNNPLGRVLKVHEDNPNLDTENLELKLGEAILKEQPALTRSLTFLKIISVVAPLMGLLGTVTGMIQTFQAITLFGTGDPKLMAGGISQALVTTVLGLCVAIPTVLLHTIVSGRSKRIMHVLQEQSAGIIAENQERVGGRAV